MEAIVEPRPELDGVVLYLFVRTQTGRIPVTIKDGRVEYGCEVQAGYELLPATLFLAAPELAALRRALIGEAIAADDALADTRAVRDRLLTMVEALVGVTLAGTAVVERPPVRGSR